MGSRQKYWMLQCPKVDCLAMLSTNWKLRFSLIWKNKHLLFSWGNSPQFDWQWATDVHFYYPVQGGQSAAHNAWHNTQTGFNYIKFIIHFNFQLFLKDKFPTFAEAKFFGNSDPAVIAERRSSIENFLQFVLNNEVKDILFFDNFFTK